MIGDQQRVIAPDSGVEAFEQGAVEQVVEGAVGAADAGVVGEVGQPLVAVDAVGFVVAGDHWVFFPQQVQVAVR